MPIYMFIYDIRSGGVDSDKRREELRKKVKSLGDWFEIGDSAYAVKTIVDKVVLAPITKLVHKEKIKGKSDTLVVLPHKGEQIAYHTEGSPCIVAGNSCDDMNFVTWLGKIAKL